MSPAPSPMLEVVGKPLFRVNRFGGGLGTWLEAVIVVRNTGSGYAAIDPEGTTYTVYGTDGSVLYAGQANLAMPRVIGFGETAYLTDQALDGPVIPKGSVGEVVADPVPFEVVAGPAPVLTASKVRTKAADGSTRTTGLIGNEGADPASNVVVIAFYLDAKGRPIGYSYGEVAGTIEPGQTRAFMTVPDIVLLRASTVKKTVVIAVPDWGQP